MREDESFADDLNVYHGAVSTRVALLLRGAEAYPSDTRFVEFSIPYLSSFHKESTSHFIVRRTVHMDSGEMIRSSI